MSVKTCIIGVDGDAYNQCQLRIGACETYGSRVIIDDSGVHVANAYHCVAVDSFERKAVV